MAATAFSVDVILAVLFAGMVVWSMLRGFFATALALAAWIVSFALAGALSSALAQPLYEAFFANTARSLIESNIDSAIQGSQAAQYAREVIADLPEALRQLAQMAGISMEGLVENLQSRAFSSTSAAQLLEQTIVAPIAIAAFRLILSIALFAILLFVTRLITRQVARLRKLPVLKQADKLLGAALGVLKGALLVFAVSLALGAAAALGIGGDAFAEAVEQSLCIRMVQSIIGISS